MNVIDLPTFYRDSVSSDVVDMHTRVMAIQNVTNLLIHTFSSQFVFPVLGHDDPGALKNQLIDYTSLGHYWRQWLPTDAIQTFNKGQSCTSYYNNYYLVVLNSYCQLDIRCYKKINNC